jgi:hypothetical protein
MSEEEWDICETADAVWCLREDDDSCAQDRINQYDIKEKIGQGR